MSDSNMISTILSSAPIQADPDVKLARGRSPCEKCWADAYNRMIAEGERSQSDHYLDLIEERNDAGTPCTEEEQRGDG